MAEVMAVPGIVEDLDLLDSALARFEEGGDDWEEDAEEEWDEEEDEDEWDEEDDDWNDDDEWDEEEEWEEESSWEDGDDD